MTRIRKLLKYSTSSSMGYIPDELLSEILARVAASSCTDLINAKLSCKYFNGMGSQDYVFKHVSLKRFPINPWRSNNGNAYFFDRCKKSGNPEALYRQGVVDYFSHMRLESGIQCLRRAANSGHAGALYVVGIILLFSGHNHNQGMKILDNIKGAVASSNEVRECREKLKTIIRLIWVKNPIIARPPPTYCTQSEHKKKQSWPSIGFEEHHSGCQACAWDSEIASIFRIFPRTNF